MNQSQRQRLVLEQKFQLWENTLIDAEYDLKIAQLLDNDQLREQATERYKSARKVLDFLTQELQNYQSTSEEV